MKKRRYAKLIRRELKEYPGVVLLGPRQCGKTTLAKNIGDLYFDLELLSDQTRLEAQWGDIINLDKLIVLDEAQSYPTVFNKIRPAIDQKRGKKGRFLILGSVSPALMKNVSESLAGRISLVEMTPFLLSELNTKNGDKSWIYGGFPDGGILKHKNYPKWAENYLSLLAQRDLPAWGLPSKPTMTLKLFRMLAAVNGQLWNASTVGSALGISYHTVNSYLNFLSEAYLVRVLQPYHINISKRLVKSPKVYFRDTGILHAILGINNSLDDLLSQPWVGASWETWIIEQIISELRVHNIVCESYFFRIDSEREIDLVLKVRSLIFAIEIKLTTEPSPAMFKKLKDSADLIKAEHRILVSRSAQTFQGNKFVSTNLSGAIKYILKHV